MNGRFNDDDWQERSLSDEDGSDEGGSGAPLNLIPRFGGSKHRERARQNADEPDEAQTDESGSEIVYIPSLDELDEREVLSNGYTVGYFRGKWFLYDEEGRRIKKAFRTREDAVDEAHGCKPSRNYGI